MKLSYESLIRSLNFSNFVIFRHQLNNLNSYSIEREEIIELVIPN